MKKRAGCLPAPGSEAEAEARNRAAVAVGGIQSAAVIFGLPVLATDQNPVLPALGAQASAVAATAGASADAAYSGGVTIFTRAKGSLMYEASVGGQKFSVDPLTK